MCRKLGVDKQEKAPRRGRVELSKEQQQHSRCTWQKACVVGAHNRSCKDGGCCCTHHCLDSQLYRCPLVDRHVCRLCGYGGRLHQQALTHHNLTATSLLQSSKQSTHNAHGDSLRKASYYNSPTGGADSTRTNRVPPAHLTRTKSRPAAFAPSPRGASVRVPTPLPG